jgi:Flp pilus assembly protein CpaB
LFSGQPPAVATTVSVLVSTQNVIKGTVLDPRMVRIRPMRPSEMQHYALAAMKLLPATETAVTLRIAKVNILADQPISESDLEPFEGSEGIPKRLAPNMHDVTIGVLQEDSAGGHVRV